MPKEKSLRGQDPVEQTLAVFQANEDRVRLAMQAGRIYFWDWDVAEDLIVWFGGLERELLIDQAPSSGAEFARLVHPADQALVSERIKAAIDGPDDYEVEFRMVRRDGSIRWTSARAIVLRDCFGQGIRMVGCDQDITERRELLLQALENEARLRTAYASLAAAEAACETGTFDWDMIENRIYVSDAYRVLYGFGPDEIVTQQSWMDRVVEEDRERVRQHGREFLVSGSHYDLEFRIQHPVKGLRWLAAIGAITRDLSGTPTRFTGINIDITVRKSREAS